MTQISPDHPHVHNGVYQCVKCRIVLTDVALPGGSELMRMVFDEGEVESA